MAKYSDPLSRVKIATPCNADWESMLGDGRRRFCAQCELNVYNLSGMTKREAEELLNQTEGRLCVRFYRRTDGIILTQDCPVGLRALRRRLSRLRTAVVSSVLTFLAGLGLYASVNEIPHTDDVMGTIQAQDWPLKDNGLPMSEEPVPAVMGEMIRRQAPDLRESDSRRVPSVRGERIALKRHRRK